MQPENQNLRLAFESLGQSLSNPMEGLKIFFDKVVPNLKSTVQATLDKIQTEYARPFEGDPKGFLRWAQNRNFMELREFNMFVPSGFRGNTLDYVRLLEECCRHAAGAEKRIIHEISNKLAIATGGSSSFAQIRIDVDRAKERGALNDRLSEFFTSSSNQSSDSKVKHHLRSNQEWVGIAETMDRCKVIVGGFKIQSLRQEIRKIEEYFKVIYDRYDAGKFAGLSEQDLTDLSNLAYELAEEMEFLAATYYRFLTIEHTVDATMGQIRRLVDKK